ncbi:MAG: hypothetical protein ACYDBW_01775 [Sulfuricaulis sp.]
MNSSDLSQEWLRRLSGLAARRRAGEFAPAVFAALYFLHWQTARQGNRFASRRYKGDPRPDRSEWLADMETSDGEVLRARLLDRLGRYQFFGVIANVPAVLVQWLRGAWPLVLREDIPDPREVLRMQARGTRAVTALTDGPRLREPVLKKSDAFAFFLHDLEHAYKFFHSPVLHAGQRAFFSSLDTAIDRGVFVPYFGDPVFIDQFHYLMSDMNTHPQHSRQYLRAILIEFYRRRECRAPAEWLTPASELAIGDVVRAVETASPAVQA